MVNDIKAKVAKDEEPQNLQDENKDSKMNNEWAKQSLVSTKSKRNSVQKKIEIPQRKFEKDQNLNALAKEMFDKQENPFQKKPFDNVKADIKKMRDHSPYRQKFLSHEKKSTQKPAKKFGTNLNLKLKSLQLHYIHPTHLSTNELLLEHDIPRRARSKSQEIASRFFRTFFLSEIKLPRRKNIIKKFVPYKENSSPKNHKESLISRNSTIKFDDGISKLDDQLTNNEFISQRQSNLDPRNKSILRKTNFSDERIFETKNESLNAGNRNSRVTQGDSTYLRKSGLDRGDDTMLTYSLGDDLDAGEDSSLRNVNMFGGSVSDVGAGDLAARQKSVGRLVRGKIEEKRKVIDGWKMEIREVERKLVEIEDGLFPEGF